MRIVIDLQAAQSPGSRNRGIGRYSIALAKAMLRHRGDHEILIALNGMFPDTIAPLREAFAGLLEPDAIRVWHAIVPPQAVSGPNRARRRAAELVRESFLASLRPDIVHVASLFESSTCSVCSITLDAHGPLTAVTLYDLIPYIYPDIYLDTPQATREYEEKIESLRQADLWLAISDSSRREGIERLELPQARVVNISSAADEHFTPGAVAADRENALRQHYGLHLPFVMYTGGIDHRKNVEGLIEAWAALPQAVRRGHQLAVVCSVQPKDRLRLEQLMAASGLSAGEALLTGFVSEQDLVDLYRLCKLFVFPSRHEGFGLPALEAMSCGAPVIGADNSSIPEVIGRADAMFDARSRTSITAKLLECLTDDALRASLVSHGKQQARQFSWDRSAKTTLEAFERMVARRRSPPPAVAATARPRLAFVSPMPPQRSGIADYSAELLPSLAAHYDIELIVDQPEVKAPQAGYGTQRTAQWFLQHGHEYDRVLYHFGNSSYHEYMFPLLERHPGTVVLHDFFLSGVVSLRERGAQLHWSRALYASHGWHALERRHHAASLPEVAYAYPANFEVLRQARGVIVHSAHALRLARQWYDPQATQDWAVVPLLRSPAPASRRQEARKRLGLAPDSFIVCSFGLLGPIKANDRLLSAWRASALASAPACQLLFVGEPQRSPYGKAFEEDLRRRPGNVRVTGWADGDSYRDYLDAADMAVQLRTLSRGETSAAVLDCLNHGLPTIANREGSMADLDPEAVWLLDREFTDGELSVAMESLWRDPARRAAMQARGEAIVRTQHEPAACAAAYAKAIEAFAAPSNPGAAAAGLVRGIGHVLGRDAPGSLLTGLAQAIAYNQPEKQPARQLLVDVTGWIPAPQPQSGPPEQQELAPLLRGLVDEPPPGWRAEPVYRTVAGEWRYARKYMLRGLACKDYLLGDDPIDVHRDDVWSTLAGPAQAAATPAPRAAELGLEPYQLPAEGDAALVWAALAASVGNGLRRQWFLDISELVQHDWRSGIQRVVKNYLQEFLLHPPEDTVVVPVYATRDQPGYLVAQDYMLRLAGIEAPEAPARAIRPRTGDVFFGLDLQPHVLPAQAPFLASLREQGVHLAFMVYDLLPLRMPDCFLPNAAPDHERWLQVVAQSDLAICISQAVADEFAAWLRKNPPAGPVLPRIGAVHLGADLTYAMSTQGLPALAREQLALIAQGPSFLMVGTIEPRKGHAQVLAAFERLWEQGSEARLVIAGRSGWLVEALVARLRAHPELGKRLLWIDDSSDEYLERIYAASTCLIAASRGEGFGLPLIEAAQHGLPVVARDLPVFREVAGGHAFYFSGDDGQSLAEALLAWLELYRAGRHPGSRGLPWLTWAQSAEKLKQLLLHNEWPAAAKG